MSTSRTIIQRLASPSNPAKTKEQIDDLELSSVRAGLMFRKPQSVLVDVQPLYRGDTRDFRYIFNKGFTARGTNVDLFLQTISPGEYSLFDSAYISTSLSKEMAASFPKPLLSGIENSYVYEIYTTRQNINITEAAL